MLRKFEITKVVKIVPGGNTVRIPSITDCVPEDIAADDNTAVLIHTMECNPLITEEQYPTISRGVRCGSLLHHVYSYQDIHRCSFDDSLEIPTRSNSLIARALKFPSQ